MDTDAIAAEHAARLAAVDPLLPAMPALDGELLTASAGRSHAVGAPGFTRRVPEEAEALWHTLVEHHLAIRVAGPDPDAALDALLDRWETHLAFEVKPGDTDTTAIVLRPSRDTVGTRTLLRRGFTPVRVTAVRPADRLGAGPGPTPGVCVRPAGTQDLDTVTELELELLRFDAQFGIVNERVGMEELVASMMRASLVGREPTLWIAEVYGRALGMVNVQLPGATSWVRPYVTAANVGYLNALAVSEAARGTGVGTALAAHAHQVFDTAGADVVLLHHALTNPRSTPFWYAQGYRPLWTYWHRRPAAR
jgi:GNAT superfamily N-acetyltransferase